MDINNSIEFTEACKILDLNPLSISNLTKKNLKKQYHKLALKFHPDKNLNQIDTTKKFQEINKSYELLSNMLGYELDNDEIDDLNSNVNNNSNINTNYFNILTIFLSNIFVNNNYKEIIKNIIFNILNENITEISNKIFDELDKESCLEIFSFLNKYKTILYLKNQVIENIKEILIKKFSKDQIIILNPSLDDLLDNNIYKLIFNNEMFLVPLWHNELYFTNKEGGDIIVFCNPVLPNNIYIDEDNELLVDLILEKDKICNLLMHDFIEFHLGKKLFKIKVENLHIKQNQLYKFNKLGISLIDEKEIYNTNNKGNIIVNIEFL